MERNTFTEEVNVLDNRILTIRKLDRWGWVTGGRAEMQLCQGYTTQTSKQQVCFPFLGKFAFHRLAQMTDQKERFEFGAKKESLWLSKLHCHSRLWVINDWDPQGSAQ